MLYMYIMYMYLVLIVGVMMMSVYSECDILHMFCDHTRTQDGTSPLIVAAGAGKTDVIFELLREGANINLQSKVCH